MGVVLCIISNIVKHRLHVWHQVRGKMQEKAAEEVHSSGTVAFLTDNSDKELFLLIFLPSPSASLKYESHVWQEVEVLSPPSPPDPAYTPPSFTLAGPDTCLLMEEDPVSCWH